MTNSKNGAAIQLVALDLDGTLLAADGSLPAQNAAAIAQVQAQGVQVIVATGKSRWSAVNVSAELGLSLPGVYSQGLIVCTADGTILREITLNQHLTDDVVTHLEQIDLPYVAYNREGLLIPVDDPYYDSIFGKYGEPAPRIMGRMAGRAAELDINKLLIGDKGDLQARRADLEKRFGDKATILQTSSEYLEIIPHGVNKGAGLGWLLAYLGIAAEAVLAIGDGENDIEMLQMAGIGVAMGNASQSVQEAANYVVGRNDDCGVAEALQRFVIK